MKTNKNLLTNLILLAILLTLCSLFLFANLRVKNDILQPISEFAQKLVSTEPRYTQEETGRETYRDASGKEFYIEFEQNLSDEELLSYEDVISHKAQMINKAGSLIGENKDLYIAEMKDITNLNYEARYRRMFAWQGDMDANILSVAANDSTITKIESARLARLWDMLGIGEYKEIKDEEKLFQNTSNLFEVGEVFATTNSLALYKRATNKLTVGNGINAGEAYVMVATRSPSTNLDVDKNQQALWVVNQEADAIKDIPKSYLGLNPEANIVANSIVEEAVAIKNYAEQVEEFKETHIIDNEKTEIYDNMWKLYDENSKKNYYESDLAGIVGYDNNKKEYLVGPFSIDYVRNIYIPQIGGQNENQTTTRKILFNSIKNAEVYGINASGQEIKLTEWEFVYPDVEYDLNTNNAVRVAEMDAIKKGDNIKNIYPYPNENFYIKFKDVTVQAITKFEFTTSSMEAEAEVYLYEGKSYKVSWKGALENGKSYLQMTPSWNEIKSGNVEGIDVADLYQVKSAEIVIKDKRITLSVGKYHEKYSRYCIPIAMELAGCVWYDGTEKEQVQNANKAFGIRDEGEIGIEGVIVNLYEDNNKKLLSSTTTDKNGNYIFEYVKVGPKYYIEFEYDGMRYKATTYLKGYINNNEYLNPQEFESFYNASHAGENSAERLQYNNQFVEIKNGNLRNKGQAISNTNNIKEIEYTTKDFTQEYIGGEAEINRYDFSARTKTKELIYPLHDIYMISNKDLTIVDNNQEYLKENNVKNTFALGKRNIVKDANYVLNVKNGEDTLVTEITENFIMIDDQLHNINLGLIERAAADFAVKNDVEKTILTFMDDTPEVNLLDFTKRDMNNFELSVRKNTQDEKYFSENYMQDVEYDKYIWKNDFSTNTNSLENDNAQMYVQYKIRVKNKAEVTSGYITELVNYYEDELYYPVDSNNMWRFYDKEINYVEEYEENGRKGYGNLIIPQIASFTSWAVKNSETQDKEELGQIVWNSKSKFDNNTVDLTSKGLKTMYTNSLSNIILEPEEYIDIYVLYKVELEKNSSILNGYGLYMSNDNSKDGKRNIIEINSYKALNVDGTAGGRVDKDSAPGNSEIGNYITYEDDIDQAPLFRLLVQGKNEGNSIVGYVWEDEKTELSGYNNQRLGNGKIDRDSNTNEVTENLINNVLVELIRLEYNQGTGQYEEVRFTDEYKKQFSDKYTETYSHVLETLIQDNNAVISWTGPNSNNENTLFPLTDGQYRFDNLVSGGTYKVRFRYGTEEQLRKEISSGNINVYTGHDYRTTISKGRVDIHSIEPSTEISLIVDSYEIVKDGKDEILYSLKNITDNLKTTNDKIKINIISTGGEAYKVCANLDEIKNGSVSSGIYSMDNAISTVRKDLQASNSSNKAVIIYNNGKDPDYTNVKGKIAELLDDGVTVFGIGYDVDSMDIFKTGKEDNKPFAYILNKTMENEICEMISNQIMEEYYLKEDISHSEDYIQNTSYFTMDGYLKSVTGRYEVMQYSQKTDPFIADSLNLNYIKTLTPDLNIGSEWSSLIKNLANCTQMTADSYQVKFFGDSEGEKILNLGLEEIPERKLEVTNQVDNIVVKLSNGEEIINLNEGNAKNVQEMINEKFFIYMDQEIMQGATIEVTYRINVSNIGEVDNLYSYVRYSTEAEKRSWYTLVTSTYIEKDIDIDEVLSITEPIKVSKLYSYYDNLIFRSADNNRWEIVNKTVDSYDNLYEKRDSRGVLMFLNEDTLYNSATNIRKEKAVWSTAEDLEVLNRNKDNVKKYSIIETTSLKDIKLYPNRAKEVIDNIDTQSNSRPISTVCTFLVLSKTLSPEDMKVNGALSYNNYVEIVNTSSNTGRRAYNGAEGNFTGNTRLTDAELVGENDIDNAETVTILPPFGRKVIKVGVNIIIGLTVLLLALIFVKRKMSYY